MECPTPYTGTNQSPASYKILPRLEHIYSLKSFAPPGQEWKIPRNFLHILVTVVHFTDQNWIYKTLYFCLTLLHFWLTLFLINFFKVYHLTLLFTLCKIVLCMWRKIIFSVTIILWKKVLICLKMNLKMSHKLR